MVSIKKTNGQGGQCVANGQGGLCVAKILKWWLLSDSVTKKRYGAAVGKPHINIKPEHFELTNCFQRDCRRALG